MEGKSINPWFISLPNSKQEVVTALIKYLFERIWKSRCDKVKREIVTQNCLQLVLKMVNITNFTASLKCTCTNVMS